MTTQSSRSEDAQAKRETAASAVSQQRLEVSVSLERVPPALANAIESLTGPTQKKSRLKSFVKDYLPALTPVATGIIAAMVSFYIYAADHNRKKEALDNALTEFGKQTTDDRARAIAAIKLAAYGDQALPAVKMVLGAEDKDLRSGGVLIAEQMYRAQTVDRETLTGTILSYYGTEDTTLQLGVLEWLEKMKFQLSDADRARAFTMLSQSIGAQAQSCLKDPREKLDVESELVNVLQVWSTKESTDLLQQMAQHCEDPDISKQAQSAFNRIKR